jgi:hypothetical protein
LVVWPKYSRIIQEDAYYSEESMSQNSAAAQDDKKTLTTLLEERKLLMQQLKDIEMQIQKIGGSISGARAYIGEAKIGRPKGSINKKSLDSIILETVYNATNEVGVNDIIEKVIAEGYVSSSSAKDFLNIVRSRLSVLKKQKKIVRNDETAKFFKAT